MQFAARLYDPDPAAYQEKNIAWMTKLPERTNACPLVVGDRIFTPAEPDELMCLDKATGKILWRRLNTLYDATPEAERAANPVFKEQIAPLAGGTRSKTDDYEKGLELRRKINELLVRADKKKYKLKWDGHFASHFGIIGFTTTPASDGKHVYAFFGYGVVACYDLDGKRQWIRRLEAKEVGYTCSPALAGRPAVLRLRRPARPGRGHRPRGVGRSGGRLHRLDHPHARRHDRRPDPPGRHGVPRLRRQASSGPTRTRAAAGAPRCSSTTRCTC